MRLTWGAWSVPGKGISAEVCMSPAYMLGLQRRSAGLSPFGSQMVEHYLRRGGTIVQSYGMEESSVLLLPFSFFVLFQNFVIWFVLI
jgi:hypothetical protein